MIDTRWFISYRISLPADDFNPKHDTVITDVTPARWYMYHRVGTNQTPLILYAEEISPALAAELVHTAGIKTDYFKEIDNG